MSEMVNDFSCEKCLYYDYDEEYDCNVCLMNLDEDEMYRFINNKSKICPYYKSGDDYSIVRKQI